MNATDYFPEVLADWIESSGRSDADIAAAIGATRVTIWRARQGKHASLELLGAICAELDKPLQQLLRERTAKKFAIAVK